MADCVLQVCIYKGFCVKEGSFAIIMKLYTYSLAHRVARAPGKAAASTHGLTICGSALAKSPICSCLAGAIGLCLYLHTQYSTVSTGVGDKALSTPQHAEGS